MILPPDPYEITTQQLIDADRIALAEVNADIARLAEEQTHLVNRLDAYELALEGYQARRPGPAKNGSHDPYAKDGPLVDLFRGLAHWQKLLVLGLMDDDRLILISPTAKFLHRISAIGGQWKHIPSRLYKLVSDHPDIFQWCAPGEFLILPNAERFLPESTRQLISLHKDQREAA